MRKDYCAESGGLESVGPTLVGTRFFRVMAALSQAATRVKRTKGLGQGRTCLKSALGNRAEPGGLGLPPVK